MGFDAVQRQDDNLAPNNYQSTTLATAFGEDSFEMWRALLNAALERSLNS